MFEVAFLERKEFRVVASCDLESYPRHLNPTHVFPIFAVFFSPFICSGGIARMLSLLVEKRFERCMKERLLINAEESLKLSLPQLLSVE